MFFSLGSATCFFILALHSAVYFTPQIYNKILEANKLNNCLIKPTGKEKKKLRVYLFLLHNMIYREKCQHCGKVTLAAQKKNYFRGQISSASPNLDLLSSGTLCSNQRCEYLTERLSWILDFFICYSLIFLLSCVARNSAAIHLRQIEKSCILLTHTGARQKTHHDSKSQRND